MFNDLKNNFFFTSSCFLKRWFMYEKTFIDFHNFVMFRNVVSTRQKKMQKKINYIMVPYTCTIIRNKEYLIHHFYRIVSKTHCS